MLLHSGVMLSLPGSHMQPWHQVAPWLPHPLPCTCSPGISPAIPNPARPWHQDGPHLDYRRHQACHALNVFVPLVDVGRANGGTEMVPSTHILGQSGFDGEPGDQIKPIVVLPKAGEALIFDYRLKHRGLANNSSDARPVVYLTFASPSNEKALNALKANFSKGRYRHLPKLVERAAQLTRAQRAARR